MSYYGADYDEEDEEEEYEEEEAPAAPQSNPNALAPIELNTKKPGAPIDLTGFVVPGRRNIVEFFESGCPACDDLEQRLRSLVACNHNYALLLVDIDELGSPVTRQLRIPEVPWLMIYDEEGQLLVRGSEADSELDGYLQANGLG